MKKYGYFLLVLLLTVSVFPVTALAENESTGVSTYETVVMHQEVISQPDGSVLEIQTVEYQLRGANYKDGSRTYTYRNNGTVMWTATLNARFYYDGTTSYCVSASLSIHFNNSSYHEVSRNVTKQGNTATANFTIGYKVLGITVSSTPYTITLSCDKNGSLS